MKKATVAIALSFALIASGAQAMSHKHARHLAAQGCTQVEELNGTCSNERHFQTHKKVSEADAMQAARDWDAQHSQPTETTDTNARFFCSDLPVDATNAQRRDCVSDQEHNRLMNQARKRL